MVGHPVTDEHKERKNYETLVKLFEEHDVIFLLMDSRVKMVTYFNGAANEK